MKKHFWKFFLLTSVFWLTSCLFAACSNATATITYDTGTDTPIPAHTAIVGTTLTPPPAPTRAGYRFDGWYLNGSPFEFKVMPSRDCTLTAHWSKTYTLTFESADGYQVPPLVAAAGESITAPQITNFFHEHLNQAVYDLYRTPMAQNFEMWAHQTFSAAGDAWVAAMQDLKQWLLARVSWLNTTWA